MLSFLLKLVLEMSYSFVYFYFMILNIYFVVKVSNGALSQWLHWVTVN